MALGAVIRNTPATVVAVCVLFVFTPFVFKSASTRWAVDAANAMPFSFRARLTVTGHGHLVGGAESVHAAWTALAVWLAGRIGDHRHVRHGDGGTYERPPARPHRR